MQDTKSEKAAHTMSKIFKHVIIPYIYVQVQANTITTNIPKMG